MPRTIEERLQEVRQSLEVREDSEQPTYIDRTNTYTAKLIDKLLADFKAEGIAHRIIADSDK